MSEEIECPRCKGKVFIKFGKVGSRQRYLCKNCQLKFVYPRFNLSFRYKKEKPKNQTQVILEERNKYIEELERLQYEEKDNWECGFCNNESELIFNGKKLCFRHFLMHCLKMQDTVNKGSNPSRIKHILHLLKGTPEEWEWVYLKTERYKKCKICEYSLGKEGYKSPLED